MSVEEVMEAADKLARGEGEDGNEEAALRDWISGAAASLPEGDRGLVVACIQLTLLTTRPASSLRDSPRSPSVGLPRWLRAFTS